MAGPARRLARVLEQFPPVDFAMAYGSQVFRQKLDAGGGMVDMVFGVRDSAAWHAANIARNGAHYSAISYLGYRAVAALQRRVPAHVYYNTMVKVPSPEGSAEEPVEVKYGVVEVRDLVRDLSQWNTLYLAGRMHKPVLELQPDHQVQEAQQQNLRAAMAAALLMLGPRFSPTDLYTIANLSYAGDFRMAFGENPHKVRALVEPHADAFAALYGPVMADFPHVSAAATGLATMAPGEEVEQEVDHAAASACARMLPPKYRRAVLEGWGEGDRDLATRRLARELRSTVSSAALSQSAKGVATAGPAKAWAYAAAKVRKRRAAVKAWGGGSPPQ